NTGFVKGTLKLTAGTEAADSAFHKTIDKIPLSDQDKVNEASAAIGAAIGTGHRVVNIAGDGSFHMNLQEIVTAVKLKLPSVVLVFNNNVLGMVRQWQDLYCEGRHSQTTLDNKTDYVKLAEAFGAYGMDISHEQDLRAAFKKAFAQEGPVIVKCDIDEDEHVLPMVPGGAPLEDIILDMEK
ncbi:MAG: thiamine pyrophosphate-dependent enzyme, partial [Christensenella sp.]